MVESAAGQFPNLKWAQRKDKVFITIDVPNCTNESIELTDDNQLKFKADSDGVTYAFDMNLFAEVDKEGSGWNTKGRNVIMTLAKKDVDQEYWPRMMKEKVKNARIAIDWSKWVDEDDEGAAKEEPGMDGFDPAMMQGMGGGGGMPGMPGMGGGMPGMPGMGGMGGMPPGMEGMMGGMGGMPGMGGAGGPGGMGGMDMEALMKQMQGMGGMPGMGGMGGGDSDDEDDEQEAEGEPKKAEDALGDLDGEAEKK